MVLHLNKEQTQLVNRALGCYERELKNQANNKDVPTKVRELVEPELFQLDLLINYFDRTMERES